jgi:hypothetical protein
MNSAADPDAGSSAFLPLDSGSESGTEKSPDPGKTPQIIFPRAEPKFF